MDVRPLEHVEAFDIEPPITRAAGYDDRARADSLAVIEVQSETAGVIGHAQLFHFIRDRHFGAEFLRLIVGPRHQGDAGDAGRKAEIVLDPGRRAGLAAERPAIEHKNGEPFRRGIDRGREPGRTGADDGHVVDPVWIDRSDQPDAAGKFVLAGIAQKLPAGAEHDRQLSGVDVEFFDQSLALQGPSPD